MGADIRREINDFYGRFATENKIDYADAVRYLNNNEVLEWRDSVEGYIEEIRKEQNPVIRERLFREYNARAYGSRITRLESLNSSIDNKLSQLYARANDQFREVLGENYTDGYYRTIYDIQNRFGYSSMFATVNDRIVDNAVSYPWSGANFSDRLWKQKADLLNQLRETLTTGFIRGESVQDMARRIAKRLEASQSNALRLIRTESSHIHNVAELDAYRECGFEEYEFMASLSERTCEVCGRLDGKRFKLSDKQYGVNFPPLHPNCRCTTIAFDPDDNLDDLKAGEMEYEEWKREFVTERAGTPEKLSTAEQKVLTNQRNSDIISLKVRDFVDRLERGKVNLSIIDSKQAPHLQMDSKSLAELKRYFEYQKYLSTSSTPITSHPKFDIKSVLFDWIDPAELVKKYAGKGTIVSRKNSDFPYEYVSTDEYIGVTFDKAVGSFVPTKRMLIVYSKSGVHVLPVLER